MKINEKRSNVIGTIGNGSELLPVPRKEPTHSYHVSFRGEPEAAIRYDVTSAHDAAGNMIDRDQSRPISIVRKPIFAEIPPNVYS